MKYGKVLLIISILLLSVGSILFFTSCLGLTGGTGIPPSDPIVVKAPWYQNFEAGTPDQTYDGQAAVVVLVYDLSADLDNINKNDFNNESLRCIKQDPNQFLKDCDHNNRMANITPMPLSEYNDASYDPDDPQRIWYTCDATDYTHLVIHYYLSECGFVSSTPDCDKKDFGDNFYIQIYHFGGETQIWTNNLRNYPNNSMMSKQWGQIVAALDDPGWTGNKIEESSIYKITVCQYDDWALYLDDIFFAKSVTPSIPD